VGWYVARSSRVSGPRSDDGLHSSQGSNRPRVVCVCVLFVCLCACVYVCVLVLSSQGRRVCVCVCVCVAICVWGVIEYWLRHDGSSAADSIQFVLGPVCRDMSIR